MQNKRRSIAYEKYCIALGKRISALIYAKGYSSPYSFWLEHGDDGLSRSSLNYILNGKSDPKLSTLRRIAEGLDIDVYELLKEV